MQIFSAGRTNERDQPKVVQEVLADLKTAILAREGFPNANAMQSNAM